MDISRILLSSSALVLGIAASAYFLIWWRRHRGERHARALLFWSIALFLFYWFQVPAILAGFGKVVTVTDFNLFFALTFPMTFLALIMVYLGILQIWGGGGGRVRVGETGIMSTRSKILFFVWFVFAITFFAYYFIVRKGIIDTFAFPFVGNLALYLPLRILIIFTAVKLIFRPELRTAYGVLGCAGIISESILGIMRNFFVIKTVLAYPPQFWYVAMTGSQFFFITQTISIILLVCGFYFLHLAYHRLRYSS